ncbi:MAG: hypothetical protein RL684_2214 [Pseudomonadota bacterium]|jgi:pimeloyl-ACP methyl ester carboxylesterase
MAASTKTSWQASIALLILAVPTAVAAPAPPAAPDYSSHDAWAAWPGREGRALDAPPGQSPLADPPVDVFFIHPTTLLLGGIANASADAGASESKRVDEAVLRFQASVFNGCCRIYAPRYRQASLKAITTNSPEAHTADELAYGDVARAFDAFLAANGGRPFILASHSQGSIHALRLLQERIIGTPLQQRLVAAYLVGLALPRDIARLGIALCDSPQATGCVLGWNSVRTGHDDRRRRDDAVIWWEGRYQPVAGRPLACVNPLDWRVDGGAPPSLNAGALYGEGRDNPLPALVPALTGARCEQGLLGVDVPWAQRRHFSDLLTVTGVYHDFDYSLFYANIRENARVRSDAWLRARR